MRKHYLLIDGNSVGHAMNANKVLSLGEFQVQAIFHFLKTLRSYCSVYQNTIPVVIWDGLAWRYKAMPGYKSDRNKAVKKYEVARAEQRKHYEKQRPYIQKALRFLGITQIVTQNMEADDMGAIMCDLYASQGARVTLLTDDRDWLQLVQPNVVWTSPVRDKPRVSIDTFEDFTGIPTPKQFVEMKALMGDKGDSLDGVGGVGEKGAIEFLKTYGSFSNFIEQVCIEKTIDLDSLPKKYRNLIEDESKAITFETNMKMMDLRTPARPAVEGLIVDPGEPSAENFRKFCDLLLFRSFTDNFDLWIEVFPVARAAQQAA